MKKNGFTLTEVSILLVIFLIVAFLVAPLSMDDTRQAKDISRWRKVQNDFVNIFYSINTNNESDADIKETLSKALENNIKNDAKSYRINFMNGTFPNDTYRFKEYKNTYANATLAIKFFDTPQDNALGLLMYDVNGKNGPNVWGRDVFGMEIYEDRFEPFCKSESISKQKQDCSKNGTGLCCSSYYLMGGNFD